MPPPLNETLQLPTVARAGEDARRVSREGNTPGRRAATGQPDTHEDGTTRGMEP